MRVLPLCLIIPFLLAGSVAPPDVHVDQPPNVLFVIGDDWSWPHAGAYGDPVIRTPNFDRVAREGVLFEHAYVSSPSCTPSRAAILTGQDFWRLGTGANLYGPLPAEHRRYTDILEENGYAVGYTRKGWGPGDAPGRNPAGPDYASFSDFMEQRPTDRPFHFWFGTFDPHRPYDVGSGMASGIPAGKIEVPPIFPDSPEVRGDIADYYLEVQRLDAELGEMLDLLERRGELDRTVVIVTSDNGMPFPRAKSHVYDMGVRVPLAIRAPGRAAAGRRVRGFVSLTDLAPTLLAMAGIEVPEAMTGLSLVDVISSDAAADSPRDAIVFGKERHVPSQEAPHGGGYPMRAIRTADYLYIKNFRPDLWPSGTPNFERAFIYPAWYGDTDAGPTKHYMVDHRDDDPHHRRLFDLAFGKRPPDELYDLTRDPDQLHNVALETDYNEIRKQLWSRLMGVLHDSGDPRVRGQGAFFDTQPYTGGVVGARGL